MGKRSGGGIIALIWDNNQEEKKTPKNAIKYRGILTKTEKRTIYYI